MQREDAVEEQSRGAEGAGRRARFKLSQPDEQLLAACGLAARERQAASIGHVRRP